MTLPGFAAETSLYRSRVRYRLIGATVQAPGVRLQLGRTHGGCGPCYWDVMGGLGTCVRNCVTCLEQPPGLCHIYSEACDPSACPVDCSVLESNCHFYGGRWEDCSGLSGGCEQCQPCCHVCT